MSEDNFQRLGEADAGTVWVQSMLYKELVAQYDNRNPSFLVRIAKMYAMSNCPLMAVIIYREVQSKMGDIVAKASLDRASSLSYYQKWIPSKNHKFLLSLQQVPQGHEKVRTLLKALAPRAYALFSSYLKKLAIETNQVGSIFLLTPGSTQDLVRRGISRGSVNLLPEGVLHDPAQIKSIPNDTLTIQRRRHQLHRDR